MSRRFDVVIVGTGHAGAQAAVSLRQKGFDGSVVMIGEESEFPYERPPLSKEYLSGDKPFERILIRPEGFWADRSIHMVLSRRVVKVKSANHEVELDDGTYIEYGHLVWAAGGYARRLSCEGSELVGVHSVRSRADVDRIVDELPQVTNVVVIGGGYIGLEAAAVLRKLDKDVIVLESQERVLARVAGEPLSRFYEAEHRAHGVKIRLATTVDCLEGHSGRVTGVRLTDGEIVPAEMVIVGIGIVPAVEPLIAAGAAGTNGVAVDSYCRTSLPDVFAVGDCALHSNAFAKGRELRLESVQNANDQAAVAALAIIGVQEAYHAVPWFWSNQYDLKLQTVGLSMDFDDLVIRGDMNDRSFSIIYLRNGEVIAIDAVNCVRDYVQGKALVNKRMKIEPGVLADTKVSLKSLANEIL